MLRKRIITAVWGLPLLVAAIWFDQPLPWFGILVTLWGGLAVFEFYKLVGKANPLTYFGLVWTMLLIISPYFKYEFAAPILLTSAVMLPLIWLLGRKEKEGAFLSWAWTAAGIFYLGWLLSHLVALRMGEEGRNWVFFTLLTTFVSDSCAFLIGRTLGKHKLAPKISPGKTWEGTIAGLIGAMLVSLIFVPSHLFTCSNPLYLEKLVYWSAMLLGLLVSIFGQLGDLVESLFKRNTGVKDSGRALPGHGGFLDRIDSIVFAGVVVYYYVIWAG